MVFYYHFTGHILYFDENFLSFYIFDALGLLRVTSCVRNFKKNYPTVQSYMKGSMEERSKSVFEFLSYCPYLVEGVLNNTLRMSYV